VSHSSVAAAAFQMRRYEPLLNRQSSNVGATSAHKNRALRRGPLSAGDRSLTAR
jgi:hypothetical protein